MKEELLYVAIPLPEETIKEVRHRLIEEKKTVRHWVKEAILEKLRKEV